MSEPAIKLLLDTSYCLYLIRSRPHHVEPAFDRFAPGEIAVSSITVDALQGYAQASTAPMQNLRALEQFLLPLVVVDFDAAAARWLARAGAQGQIAGNVHAALLAAHARRLGATLVTHRPELYQGMLELSICREVGDVLGTLEDIGIAAGSLAPRFRRPTTGPHTIVLTGSHDLSIDLLADELHATHPGPGPCRCARRQHDRSACPPGTDRPPGRLTPARRRHR
ncbi:MAG: type II toxin-antitoxin system VapC family toxin [Anaerolineales bacterium]|nr:type II toxin-antitoxin system VapC family toxin [Anaerolineales bacterium]